MSRLALALPPTGQREARRGQLEQEAAGSYRTGKNGITARCGIATAKLVSMPGARLPQPVIRLAAYPQGCGRESPKSASRRAHFLLLLARGMSDPTRPSHFIGNFFCTKRRFSSLRAPNI